MKKRILAVLLVLAMIVVAGAFAVSATHPDSAACQHCTAEEIEWKEWNAEAGASVTEGGHYYLNANVEELSSNYFIGTAETPVDVVLDLRGFSITSATTRVFYVRAGSTLSLMDSNTETPGAITGANNDSGGVLYVEGAADNHATVNLYTVVITSNSTGSTSSAGGAIYASNSDVLIDGATINGGTAAYGGAIALQNANVTMLSGTVSGGTATGRGGNFRLNGKSTVTISGGTVTGGITSNTSSSGMGGGNFIVEGTSVLNVSGTAVIKDGEAKQGANGSNSGGGNILINDSCTLNLSGGTIQNGKCNASGGNILARGSLNMTGGQIIGGTCTTKLSSTVGGSSVAIRIDKANSSISGGSITGGDVAIVRDSGAKTITVSGNPVIERITFRSAVDYRLTVGELTKGAQIGLEKASTSGSVAFTSGDTSAYAQYFKVVSADATLLETGLNENNEIVGVAAACPHCGLTDVTWTPWTLTNGGSGKDLTEDAHYYLTGNVLSITSMIRVGVSGSATPKVVIDLRGYNIQNKDGSNVRTFGVYPGASLFLMDSGVDGVVRGATSGTASTNDGGVIYVNGGTDADGNKTTFTLHSGTLLYGGTGGRNGGVIYAGNTTVTNINGGTITGGIANNLGGNIYVTGSAAELNVSGTALIENGHATSYAGNIYISGSAANITGGTITGGKTDASAYGGGNIYNTGKLNISGTAIIEKGARTSTTTSGIRGGGNIYNTGTLDISGGIIRDGIVAKSDAGANIHMNGGTITVSGGTISGGTIYDGKTNAEELSGIKGIAFRAGTGIIKGDPVIDDIGNSMYKSGDTISGWSTLTISGEPTIGLIDGATIDSADYRLITLGENGVTGGSITVNAEKGAVFTVASEKAEASMPYIHNVDEKLELVLNDDNTLVFNAAVPKPIEEFCEHCGEEAGKQTWLPLTENTLSDLVGGETEDIHYHYYLVNDISTGVRVRPTYATGATTYGNLCLDLNGFTWECTNNAAFWVRGGDLAIMDSGKTGKVIGKGTATGGVIYISGANGDFDLYGGTLQYAGTGVNAGGVIGSIEKGSIVNIHGGKLMGGKTKATGTTGGNIHITGTNAELNIADGVIIEGGVATGAGDNINIGSGVKATISGAKITDGDVKVSAAQLTLSGAPVIEELDLTAASPVVLNELTSGADITVIAAVGKAFTEASDYAQAALDNGYIKSAVENAELKCVDNCLILQIPVLKAFCEHCGEEAGEQDWLPLTDETYTATGSSATLPNGHYYLPADLSNTNRVNVSEGKICLDLHGKTLTATNIMPFWVKGTGDLGIMDTVGGGELQGAAGNGYGGGVIRMTGGAATVYGGTLRYIGTKGADEGGVIFVNAASFTMKGGHLTGGYCTYYTNKNGETCSARGGIIYISGEGSATIEGGTMDLGNAEGGYNGIYLVNNNSTLNVGADATEALEVLDGNVTGNAYSPINMPYGIGLATVDADATVRCTWYADTAEAIAAYSQTGNYLKVLGNTGDLTLDGTYIVDLAGNSITITGGTVYGMDSANDEYDATACGTATVEAPATYCVAPNGYIYIAVEGENGFTFHRLRMAFERLSLRPGVAGVYYSSSWRGDEVLTGTVSDMQYETESMITGYGMALKKNSAATGESFENGDRFAYTFFDNVEGIASNFLANKNGKEINSCLLSNIINAENGAEINDQNAQVMIYATPYIAFVNYEGNTEYVMGPAYGNNLYGIAKYVIDTIAAMEDADARAKNVNKISALETFADACGVTFEGLTDLIHPTEPAPEETTAPTVAE